MGGSSWCYFTEYQEDIQMAFKQLQEQIFHDGEYDALWKIFAEDKKVHGDYVLSKEKFYEPYAGKSLAELASPPQTIEELRERCDLEGGTSSILDMLQVGPKAKYLTIGPFPKEMLVHYLGTEYPTRHDIEKGFGLEEPEEAREAFGLEEPEYLKEAREASGLEEPGNIWLAIKIWTGFYTTVYKKKKPDAIFFAGWSGD